MAGYAHDVIRAAIVNYIGTLNLGTYKLSTQLPWTDNGRPLYWNNKKHIYVDTPNTAQQNLFNTTDANSAVAEIITVSVYFVTDAKQLPSNYDSGVEAIKGARTLSTITGVMSRMVNVSNTYGVDELLTKFDFSFRRVITN